MKKKFKRFITLATMLSTLLACTVSASALTVTYIPMNVPNINSSFKSYMDYGCITSQSSPQYKWLQRWCWVDYDGFIRCDGESEFGISDYYCVAMGSYYGREIGTKYRITTDTGNVFYVVLCDQKADCNTNSTYQYGTDNNDVIEFIVNTYSSIDPDTGKYRKQALYNSEYSTLVNNVQSAGSANVYMPLNGSIESIEKLNFQ